MSDNYAARVAEYVRGRNVWELSAAADVADPDSRDSSGARFLLAVRDDLAEAIEYAAPECSNDLERLWDDRGHEIADSAVPVYNAERWDAAGDLCAYLEDVSDLGMPSDVLEATGWALYIIAGRLISALLSDAIENADADD